MECKIIPIKINLVKKDEQFLHLQELIVFKRKMLLEKQRKLHNITKQNQFLNAIKNDYQKYNNYINQQKMEQIDALNLLNNYINDLTTSGKLSKNNIDDANYEQERITKEINKIKKGLDNIIKDTNDISSTLKEKNII
jgi:hypothetical protein